MALKLPQLPVDTANHFVYGSVIFFAAMAWQAAATTDANPDNALWAVSFCALGKEVLDRLLNLIAAYRGRPASHSVEWSDFFATHLGGVAPWAAAHLATRACVTLS